MSLSVSTFYISQLLYVLKQNTMHGYTLRHHNLGTLYLDIFWMEKEKDSISHVDHDIRIDFVIVSTTFKLSVLEN